MITRADLHLIGSSFGTGHAGLIEKDQTIADLLSWLREQLGDSFAIADHWEADLCAIGISARDDPKRLAYICSYGRPALHYAVHLELAPLAGSDVPYKEAGRFSVVGRDELLRIVRRHFGIPAR